MTKPDVNYIHAHFARTSRSGDTNKEQQSELKLYYKGSMSTTYKKDEKILRDIVSKNCTPTRAHWRKKVPKWWVQLNFEPIFRYLQNCDGI